MGSRGGRAATAVLVTMAFVVSACGSSSKGGSSAGTPSASSTPSATQAPLTASDVGVTADSIRVGFIVTDLAQTKKLLGDIGADKADQQASYQAFVDEVNAGGGINGRKIVPVFTSFDPVKDNDASTACTKLTEDEKVFAIISNGMYGAAVLCVTQQHSTPLINVGGFIDEYYTKSNGLLYTMQPTKPRSARNTVAALEAQGALQGKTIGVLTSQAGDDDVAVKTALVPAVKQLGHPVGLVADLAVDSGAALGQLPVQVTQMRNAGVNVVFLSTNAYFSSLFVQKADEQGYRPLYAVSDADDNIADYFVGRMPASFQADGFTAKRTGEQRTADAEAPTDANCRAVVEKSTGKKLARGTTTYDMAMGACNEVRLFVRAAKAAGTNLTQAGLGKSMQGLGSFQQAYANGGSFSATKSDAADYIRPVKADMTCKCWMPQGAFEKMKY
jgi:ABC-type branched-subunit amino acid transport system substrate-binding protein